MELRNLGASGLRTPLVGLGCNGFADSDKSAAVFAAALDAGVTFFDTADIYGGAGGVSEQILGELVSGRRDEVILATKCGFLPDGTYRRMGASRRYIQQAVEASLRRLRTDHIDLYQIHTPDPLTPIEETLEALDDLVRQGKVLYVGASNYAAWQLVDAHWTARTRGLAKFVSTQCEYNLLSRSAETEVLPAIAACGVGLLPYFPLASGLLSGGYRNGPPKRSGPAAQLLTDVNIAKAEALAVFAASRGRTPVELAMSWLASNANVSCIIAGASRPEQVAENARAATWRLTPEDLAEIDRLSL